MCKVCTQTKRILKFIKKEKRILMYEHKKEDRR